MMGSTAIESIDPESQRRNMANAKVMPGFALSVVQVAGTTETTLPARAPSTFVIIETGRSTHDPVHERTFFGGTRCLHVRHAKRTRNGPTKWVSNAPRLRHRLSVRCDGRHTHTWRPAGRHPPAIAAIVRGIQAQREPPWSKVTLTASAAEEQAWGEKVVKDEYTGEPLDNELVVRGKVMEWTENHRHQVDLQQWRHGEPGKSLSPCLPGSEDLQVRRLFRGHSADRGFAPRTHLG